ncbi:MAG: imelysin family protein [Proteobacteria bacterium]|nr:imelysin family protein [Pseudomonadota bacterium]
MDSAAGRSWLLVAAIALIAVTLRASGCTEPEPVPDPLEGYDLGPFLTGVADVHVDAGYAAFRDAAVSLEGELTSWLETLQDGGDDAARLESARIAWRAAFMLWQQTEVLQLGPAAAPPSVGGEAIRDEIYSWPTVNDCLVDQGLVDQRYADADFFEANLVNAYGLDAIEWLLFGTLTETFCPSQAIEPSDWDALGDDGVLLRRAEYALVAATGIVDVAAVLHTDWGIDGGVGDQLASPTEDGLWASDRAALQGVFAALFYLETSVKDRKLGRPLGLLDCTTGDTCPEDFEGPWAGSAVSAVRANLTQIRTIAAGANDAPGIVDLLAHVGGQALGDDLLAALDEAIAAADAVGDADPATVLADSPQDLLAIHDAIKRATDLLKGEVAIVLALTVPAESAGDND